MLVNMNLEIKEKEKGIQEALAFITKLIRRF